MTDTPDTNKVVAAILAAAQVSTGGDQSTGRYVSAYNEMYKALGEKQSQDNASVLRAFEEVNRRRNENN